MSIQRERISEIDAFIERALDVARIPGAAVAVVLGSEVAFAKGYGYRDLNARLPMTEETVYPIASTTKAMNATLLGMLVDEGRLEWDVPVQRHLPRFRLRDPLISALVTVRDLLTMRTGLPRHDWSWNENPVRRAELIEMFQHLELSSGFRERFQYNNMTVTAAAHVAEVITGQSWEQSLKERLFDVLQMRNTGFGNPAACNVTLSYHENSARQLVTTQRRENPVVAPAGSMIHSTVVDMARWLSFNLCHGKVAEHRLIEPGTLAQICSPQMVVGTDPSAPTPGAAYAMGWFVDTYRCCPRLSHGGYGYDVHSEVMLFPKEGIGIVSFINFGAPAMARLIGQQVFELIVGLPPGQNAEERVSQYEKAITANHERNASAHRVMGTSPSHPLREYAGAYRHPAYGTIEISLRGDELTLRRNRIILALEHWHYDAWVGKDSEYFAIHASNPFDPTHRVLFETDAEGAIAALSIRLEPVVAPIRFTKL